LVEGYFTLKPLGPARVKGVSEPVEIFEVTGLGALRTRLERSATRGLTKFVGRGREMETLKHALQQARESHGQIVAAMAEAGVGKSRVFYEFKVVAQSGCMLLEAYSVSHGNASAYLPVIELLHSYFSIEMIDDLRKRREKVTRRVIALDNSLQDTLPYLFALLGMVEGDDPLAQMDGQVKKRRTLEAIKRMLLRESLNQPLIVIFEDLHWIDQQTQEFLNLLADSIATARILLLVNYRPEYSHNWSNKTYYAQLRLDALGADSAEEMLTALLGAAAELTPLKRLIIERTEGTPFFMEEMVQALFEDGSLIRNGIMKLTRPLTHIRVPATVQAVLASRIDRLPPEEKELLHTLAVLGRQFPLGLVQRLVLKPRNELEELLWRLQIGEFIYEQPAFPDPEYIFKHALTQEVAYNSVLIERRKLLHERAGVAMESFHAARLEDHLEELAHHYSHSDNIAKAAEYLGLAAAQALSRSHHNQAIAHASGALKLLDRLPQSPDRLRSELALQVTVGQACMQTIGYAAPEVERAFSRAEAICRQLKNPTEMLPVLWGLCAYYHARADFLKNRDVAEQALGIASAEGSPLSAVGRYFELGACLSCLGRFDEAGQNLEQAIALYGGQMIVNGTDALVVSLGYAAWTALFLGHPDQALNMSGRALEHARHLNHLPSVVYAQASKVLVRVLRRDQEITQEAEALIASSMEHGFPFFQMFGASVRSLALLERGSAKEALTGLSETVEYSRTTGTRIGLPLWLSGLAEAYGKVGNPDKGLNATAEALAEMEVSSERRWEAEVHRVKGELLLMQNVPDAEQAEQSFRRAIEVARRQNARFWELRATTSLARLFDQRGQSDEAHMMLAEIYSWFTEGFDIADLKDAKTLLDN